MDTYTTEEAMLLTRKPRRQIYTLANRYGWSEGVDRPDWLKRLRADKVNEYITAEAITAQAVRLRGYGKQGRLLWPVTECPACKKPASFIRTSIFCIDGHYTER